ncbi:MAG: hypothetical protein OXO54_05905 [Chloroflexota bacterium]|nr:hypothetical protein [Chloroflexota bacterium]
MTMAMYTGAALRDLPPLSGNQYHYGHVDNLLNLYTLEWMRYAIVAEPQRLFTGLAYYGMGDSLFYTHLLLGGLPIYAPVAALFGPGAGLNAMTIASPILNGLATAAAAWLLVGRWWPAAIAGFVFAFAPIQKEFYQFHHLMLFWWTPLAFAFWFWFRTKPAWWKLCAVWVCLLIQFASGVYLGFMSAVVLLALVAASFAGRSGPPLDRRLIARAAGASAIATLPFIPLLVGYVGFWLDHQEARTLDEAHVLSARLPVYLPWVTQSLGWFQTVSARVPGLWPVVPGIIPAVLATLGLAAGIRRGRLRAPTIALGISGALLFALTLGPQLWWHSQPTGLALPFAAAHAVIPGFASLRNPTFFASGMMLTMALLTAIAVAQLDQWRQTRGWRGHAIAAALLVLLAAESARAPIYEAPIPYEHGLQSALAQVPNGAVAFVPSGADFTSPEPYMRRMWWSLNGGRQPVVSGYSGYRPRGTDYLARLMDWSGVNSRPKVIDALRAFGVRTLVLDRKYLSSMEAEAWRAVSVATRPGRQPLEDDRFVVLPLGSNDVRASIGWSAVDVQLVVRAALPDSAVVIPVTLRNSTELPWLPPPGRRTRTAELVWERPDGAEVAHQTVRLRPPPVVPAGETAQALSPLTAMSPEIPGAYRVRLRLDGQRLASAETEVRAQAGFTDRPPNRAELRVLSPPVCLSLGNRAHLRVQAMNDGSNAWYARHRLGTRWTVPDNRFVSEDLTLLEGRLGVPYNVKSPTWTSIPPGSGFVFEGVVEAPSTPGVYMLTLGMVEEDVAWFSETSIPAVVVEASDWRACNHSDAH